MERIVVELVINLFHSVFALLYSPDNFAENYYKEKLMIPARKLFGMVVGIHNVLRTQSENIYYTSRLWRSKNGYNLPGCMTGSDSQETKLPTYRKTLCLGMKIGKNVSFIVI